MFKHYFEGIQNVELAPVASLVLFFVFFIIVIIRIFKIDKSFIKHMENLPMEDGSNKSESKGE